MNRLLREPLLHFLALGALLFALYGWLNREAMLPANEVVVDQARVDGLARQFEQVWQRPPTLGELQRLVDEWARDEIVYREGLAAGMDRDDALVRRRVVQRMKFMVESMATELPDDSELEAWLRSHPGRYWIAPTYTFQQVYINPQQGPSALALRTEQALSALQRDPQANVGDDTLLPASMKDARADDVASVFGKRFVEALAELPVGKWSGPIASRMGVHLIRITTRESGRAATLAQVRQRVERDVLEARSRRAVEDFQSELGKRYSVTVDADLGRALRAGEPEAEPIAGTP